MAKARQRRALDRGSLLEAALEYARQGLPVVPCHSVNEDGVCTCRAAADCSTPGKHPRTRNGFKDATTDEAQIKRWWQKWADANIGGVGGEHICLDVDAKSGGLATLRDLEREHGEVPRGAVVKTGKVGGKRGRHYWFRNPNGVALASRAGVRPGIDIRATNGYAILPPSKHPSGVEYEWEAPPSFNDGAPQWVIDLAPEYVAGDSTWEPNENFRMSREVRDFIAGKHEVPPGEQREFLTRAARSVLTTGKSVEQTAGLLFEGKDGSGGLSACEWSEDPWTDEEVLDLVEDIFRKGPTTALEQEFRDPFERTEEGTAARFAATVRSEVRYIAKKKEWVVWHDEEGRWKEVTEVEVRDRVRDFIRSTMENVGGLDDDTLQAQAKWVHSFLSRARLNAVTELARGRPLLADPSEFDNEPWLLNCRNGTLDLRTLELREHRREDMLTQQISADYDPDAHSEDWERVLSDSMQSDDLVSYLQRVFGYCLTGDTREEKFFFFHGKAGSGKSTILDSFSRMLGDYARVISNRTLTYSPGQAGAAHSEDVARLHGARFAVASEFEQGARFATAFVNTLTGGESVTARHLHQPSFQFHPQLKLFLAANSKPQMPSSPQSGIWRRLQLMPFKHAPKRPDANLKKRLATNEARAAILAWAVEGLRTWNEQGLGEVPAEIDDANKEYKEESDPYSLFIGDCVDQVVGAETPVSVMYEVYHRWAELNGHRPASKNRLGKELKARGFEQEKHDETVDGQRETYRFWLDVEAARPKAPLGMKGDK